MQRRLSLAVGSLLVGLPIHLLWGLPDSNPANFTSFLFAIASLVIFAYAISKHKIFYTKYRYELRLLANILMMNIVLKYAIPRFALTSNILDVMVDFIGTYIIDLGEYMCTSTCSDLITLACAAALLDYALRTTLMVEDAARFYNSLEIM
ncbi:hypothetical protein AAG570_009768 [Ranatra chinensis]|uniref:Uncharacterized protein n=1 Tax=Ranatra chinensis TaxID=642074 RepID=A0ABD0Z757_9HEMI